MTGISILYRNPVPKEPKWLYVPEPIRKTCSPPTARVGFGYGEDGTEATMESGEDRGRYGMVKGILEKISVDFTIRRQILTGHEARI